MQTNNNDLALHTAITGNTHFSIKAICKEAWKKVKGIKKSLWGALLINYAIMFDVAVISGLISSCLLTIGALLFLHVDPIKQGIDSNILLHQLPSTFVFLHWVVLIILFAVEICIVVPMSAGATLISMRWINKSRAGAYYIMKFFTRNYIWKLFSAVVLFFLTFYILGFIVGAISYPLYLDQLNLFLKIVIGLIDVLLVLAFIYFAVAFLFVIPLIIDRNLGGWTAIKTSVKAVTSHWFKVFGLLILMNIVVLISMITVIGLIWSLPWCFNVYSITYREIFGMAEQDPVSLAEREL